MERLQLCGQRHLFRGESVVIGRQSQSWLRAHEMHEGFCGGESAASGWLVCLAGLDGSRRET